MRTTRAPAVVALGAPVPRGRARSTGRLTGRAAVAGADSGVGRAAAIAYAREGADVVLAYLPSETFDAAEVIAGLHSRHHQRAFSTR